MISIHFAVLLTAGALAFWALGGVVLRLGGWLYLAVGALGALFGRRAAALPPARRGDVLLGYWHYALRHGV